MFFFRIILRLNCNIFPLRLRVIVGLKFLLWNINNIFYIDSGFSVFSSLSKTKSKFILFLTNRLYWFPSFRSLFLNISSFTLIGRTRNILILYILNNIPIKISKLKEKLLNLPKRIKLNILCFSCKKFLSNDLLFVLLLRRVRIIVNSSSIQ